jgi:hypothetical protein
MSFKARSGRLSRLRPPDDVPVRALCPRMVRTRCGMIGANVRPDYFNKPRV